MSGRERAGKEHENFRLRAVGSFLGNNNWIVNFVLDPNNQCFLRPKDNIKIMATILVRRA